ncbi:AsmA family protein [Aureimonas populi]|uniref:AsmA family protein n=1 Tax=Aureimonas populi TaxID=1701758 RepID=A0ABW5CMM0_9HYPH|nr:AsmA family protein [Aureimonas populi]
MRIFIAIGGLVVLLLCAALVVPLFVDWTAFREDFEREASRALGQPVRVAGEAEARLLPFPSLTFTDVVVGPDGAEPVMTLERFRMDAELAPYLSGEIRIFQMRLESPHLRVKLGADGRPAGPPLAGATGSNVILENVEITNGRVSLQNRETGRTRELAGIEAQLSAQTLSGPFAGGGALSLDGRPFTFSLASGRIAPEGEWPLRLTLSSAPLGASFMFDGTTLVGDGALDFSGGFELVSPLPGEEAGTLPPVRLTSALALTPRRAEFTSMRAEIGGGERPYVLSGEGSLDIADIPHFTLSLQGEQVDVDALPGATPGEGGAAPDFPARAEAVRRTLAAIPPVEIPGEIELVLPVVTAGDTTIRNTRFRGSPTGGGWAIRELSAELPGRTLVEASGLMTVRESLGFAGDLLVAARQPGRFASWLTGTAAEPAVAALSRAGFSGRVRLSEREQVFESLEVDVGGQRLVGRLERGGEPGARQLSADLAGEAADLDAFLAFARVFSGGAEIIEPVEAMDLRIDAGPVSLAGYQADTLAADFSFADDLLDLRSLIVEGLAGMTLDARGTVAELSTSPRPDLAFELGAEDSAQAAGLLVRAFPDHPIMDTLAVRLRPLGALAVSGVVSAPPDAESGALRVSLEGQAGETQLALTAQAGEGLAALREGGRFEANASLSSEEPGLLLSQLGLAGIDLGLPAPLTVTASLSGEDISAARTELALSAPGSQASLSGTTGFDASGLASADLDLRASSEDASLWLVASGTAFGQGLDAVPLDLSARLGWTREGWRLEGIEGTVVQTGIAGALAADAGGPVGGGLSLSDLSLPWLATVVYAGPPDGGAGEGWPEQPFGSSLLPRTAFVVDLEAGRLDLGGGAEARDFTATVEGGADRLRLLDAAASLAGGRPAGRVEMRNAGGLGSLAFDLSMEDARLPAGGPLEGILTGRIAGEGSGQSFAALASSLTGEGRVALAEAALRGIAPSRLPGLLAAVDAQGFELESEPVAGLLRQADEGAAYPLGDVEADLVLGLGALRVLPVSLEAGDERLVGSGSIRLADFGVEGTLALAFTPPEAERLPDTAPAIGYRIDGPFGAPFVLSDVEPLTSYLSLRAYAREQERLEAMREDLRETLRLRREARYYRHLAAERERAEAERLRLEQEAEAARQEAERAAAEEEQERIRAEEAERARAEEAAQSADPAAPAVSLPEPLLQEPEAPGPAGPPPPSYEGLPGVGPPLDF